MLVVCSLEIFQSINVFYCFRPQLFLNYRTSDGGKVKNMRQCSNLYPNCKTPHETFAENASDIDIETTTQLPVQSKQKKIFFPLFGR